jgi:hypothetical protein
MDRNVLAACGYADLHVHMFAIWLTAERWLLAKPGIRWCECCLGEITDRLPLVDKNGNPKHVVDGSAGARMPNFLLEAGLAGARCYFSDHRL